MKDYLLLIRGGDERMAKLSKEERSEHIQKWGAFMEKLTESGNLTGGFPLATDGRIMSNSGIEEGVVANVKGEAIGGYLLLKANDYNHAIELSKDCPVFEHGGNLEIRESMHMG